jgi:CelD/BcsL family acetyltransferase involved in cellulose biosynthesis
MTWQIFPLSRFTELAPQWDALQRECSDLPFLESLFLTPLLTEFSSGREVLAVDVRGGAWHCAAILTPNRRGAWETFQPSQLPLGAWVGPQSSMASPHWAQEVEGLCAALPGFSLTVGLTQLDSRFHPRPANAATRSSMDYIDTAWVDVNQSFDTYWEGRGKNLKQNCRKQRNKLETDGVAAVLECVTAPDAVAQAMVDYGALEGAGWKAANGTAVMPGNAQGRFYRTMLENFCKQGRARIYRYRFNDKVVSMDLCITSNSTIVILKTAYDESYKTVSPSSLMRQDEFLALFGEATFKRIEFYGKVMEWHTRWTDNARGVYHLTVYRWGLVQRLRRKLASWRKNPVGSDEAATAPSAEALPKV